jgi:hypothetical protein
MEDLDQATRRLGYVHAIYVLLLPSATSTMYLPHTFTSPRHGHWRWGCYLG